MAKRYGRNHRRRHRQQLANATFAVWNANRGLSYAQSKLKDLERRTVTLEARYQIDSLRLDMTGKEEMPRLHDHLLRELASILADKLITEGLIDREELRTHDRDIITFAGRLSVVKPL